MPEPDQTLHAIHSKLLQFSDKLFEALEDLEAAGGLPALARVMKPAALARTTKVLKSTRQALDEQLARLKADNRARGSGGGRRPERAGGDVVGP